MQVCNYLNLVRPGCGWSVIVESKRDNDLEEGPGNDVVSSFVPSLTRLIFRHFEFLYDLCCKLCKVTVN